MVITDVLFFPHYCAADTQHAREIRVAREAGFGHTKDVLFRKRQRARRSPAGWVILLDSGVTRASCGQVFFDPN
jgi:hypothetical protein